MKTNRSFSFLLTGLIGAALAHLSVPTVHAQVIANSVTEFSGNQGQNGWFNGYRNYTLSGETENYDPKADFIPYDGGAGLGAWDGFSQFWTGTAWDLNTAAAGPWTTQGPQTTHPNGSNSAPNEEHWTIRRWAATELTAPAVLQVIWTVRKQDTAGGNGVTGGIWLNGKKVVAVAIAANSSQGVTRTNYISIKSTDVLDLVLTPVGPNGVRTDGNDNSVTTMQVVMVADSDSDGLPDPWESLYSPGDLAKLRAAGDEIGRAHV